MRALAGLTPEHQLRIHIAKAREFWLEDRLDLALVAVGNALRVGLHPGDWYDFQRTVEAEHAARMAGSRWRVEEHLVLEADPAHWGAAWRDRVGLACDAVAAVQARLAVRWGKVVLLTLVPEDDWVAFLHSRYGYYAERMESHKIVLPARTVVSAGTFRRAVLHEAAHAAVHHLAGDRAPRWLDEGVAVWMEGGVPHIDAKRLRMARRSDRALSLDQVSAGFESYGTDLGSEHAAYCYAAAGDFVQRLISRYDVATLRDLLVRTGRGDDVDRAFRRVVGVPLRKAEDEWLRG